jgi:small subunit ribosomal protein S17
MARTITGTVVSDKGDKTIVINVVTRKTHPIYKKQYTVNTKYMAHDEKNDAKTGDVVIVAETRPISRRKHFSLTKIVERGGVRFQESDATADIPVEEEPVEVKEVKTPARKRTSKEEV